MNNFFKLLMLLPIIIVGCKTTKIDDKTISQSINSLYMNIFSNEGKKIISIQSPYSNYDKNKNSYNLKQTTIVLFKNNNSEYIITSEKSEISNNNKLIELDGNVQVKTINKDEDKLFSDGFIWNTDSSEFVLMGNVKFQNELITLTSNKATLNKKNNIIEFFNPVQYKFAKSETSGYEVNSENAFYNIETKSVSFKSKDKKVRSKVYY